MTKIVQIHRLATAQAAAYTGPDGEVIKDTGLNTLRVQDGATPGGNLLLAGANNLEEISNPATARVNLGAAPLVSPNFTGPVGIGMNPVNFLDITHNQNATSKTSFLNNDGGANALSTFVADNGTHTTNVYQLGEGYVGTGVLAAGYGGIATGSGLFVNAGAGKPILFGIGAGPGTEAARFDANKRLLIGVTASNNYQLEVNSSAGGAGGFFFPTGLVGIDIISTGSSNQVYERFFVSPGGVQTQTGSISTNGTSTSFNTSSDVRVKDNIMDATEASAIIDALRVRSWDWKSDGTHEAYGFIAQEEVLVAPFAVTPGDDNPEIVEVQWGRDDSKLVPLLVKEIQSLRARLAALEAK